ncbi:hypothetical protein LEN26_009174 [Aphanomyces euteiches]|nr:hypothetical protein LEN26_009174 [Aphanomyces euteiches]
MSHPANTTQPAADIKATANTAVDQTYAHFDTAQKYQALPNQPNPPLFDGVTAAEKKKIMREYQHYWHHLASLQNLGFKPLIMPVGNCISDYRRRMIARYEMGGIPLANVTEEMWQQYFRNADAIGMVDYANVDRAMRGLKMRTELTDATSRVFDLVHTMHHRLEKLSMQFMTDDEQKRVIGYLTAALAPAAFKTRVLESLSRNSNKYLRSDLTKFVACLHEKTELFMSWEDFTSMTVLLLPSSTSNVQTLARILQDAISHVPSDTMEKCDPEILPARRAASVPGAPARRTPAGVNTSGRTRYPTPSFASCGGQHTGSRCPGRTAINTLHLSPASDPLPIPAHDCAVSVVVEDSLALDRVLVDSGADACIVNAALVDAIIARGSQCDRVSYVSQHLEPFHGPAVVVNEQVCLGTVSLTTPTGPLVLQNVHAWVLQDGAIAPRMILSRHVMHSLGFSLPSLLVAARDRQHVWDMAHLRQGSLPLAAVALASEVSFSPPAHVVHARSTSPSPPVDHSPDIVTDNSDIVDFPSVKPPEDVTVRELLAKRVIEARAQGMPEEALGRLEDLLLHYEDVFRLSFGSDPPVRVPPLEVKLRSGATPVRCATRRYPPAHREFLDQHIDELVKAGLVYLNTHSRWASPPRIVPKSDGSYRMTVDTRGVNARTDPLQWPMPQLEVALGCVTDCRFFFTLDWFRGYWQLPLAPSSQELFTIMTHRGMFTPTRVLMGGCDSVSYSWLDDILGYSPTVDGLLDVLESCSFYMTTAKWCGELISAKGISHCPERIAGLSDLATPRTAAQLQQFLCAANWMRASLPMYTALVDPLMRILDVAAKSVASRKQRKLEKVFLADFGWSDVHTRCFANIKAALSAMVPLGHPSASDIVCLFADASNDFWGSIVTQIPSEDADLPIAQQRHCPLAFLSGRFVDAASRWPIPDKEAFAIVESCKRLEYLLLRPGGFVIYTDHRNLTYMFNPMATDSSMQRHQADRIQRWAMVLTGYTYTIVHIPGDSNVWADMLSRWLSPEITLSSVTLGLPKRTSMVASHSPAAPVPLLDVPSQSDSDMVCALAVPLISPLTDPGFIWPSLEEIASIQAAAGDERPTDVMQAVGSPCLVNGTGSVWIPSSAKDLQIRICVVAHAGNSGHRGRDATLTSITSWCFWPTLRHDVETFLRSCLHCLSIGGRLVPRPFGEQLHATQRNELLHADFLTLPMDTETGFAYVLLVKDDATFFSRAYGSVDVTAAAFAAGLLDWFSMFGVVETWVTDRGSHFKNEVITALASSLGSQHHFTTEYSPWSNGSIEVLNRQFLRCLRALLSERKLMVTQWTKLLPSVMSALNHQPVDRLGGVAPITAFTGLNATTPLRVMFTPPLEVVSLAPDALSTCWQSNIAELALAMDSMHRSIALVSSTRRQQAVRNVQSERGSPSAKIDFDLAWSKTHYKGSF